ncbi:MULTISPECIES: polyketide cyclase [unclassified Dysgonomonas]|uniref:polyketide cyclase n=1 Tax=unclassified Dysgonomonas TaxID=2630389 RepID=UPI0006820BE0|nr:MULTISPECIES: polyketide cyclase [unclassified Dysgonomonas]MBD8347724.1 SRPBCC family protein [Dysgonomonas sp. HGC4]MBF0577332.1 SRPBCC family protein [Dysgonomonas sp. GY617]
MAEYISDIKTIPYSDQEIFTVLSDLRKLDLIKDKIPQDKIKDFSYDQDSCTVTVDPIGKVRFVIVEREPNSTIKFEAEQLPFKLTLWIQLKQSTAEETKMKLTVKADINAFLKPMISKPLQNGLDKMAETLATIPYGDLAEK